MLCEQFHAAEVAAVAKLFPRRKYILTADQAFVGPPIPDWWQTAIHYANYLDKALLDVPNLIKRDQGSLEYALKQGGGSAVQRAGRIEEGPSICCHL